MLLKEGHDAVDGEGHIAKLMRVVRARNGWW